MTEFFFRTQAANQALELMFEAATYITVVADFEDFEGKPLRTEATILFGFEDTIHACESPCLIMEIQYDYGDFSADWTWDILNWLQVKKPTMINEDEASHYGRCDTCGAACDTNGCTVNKYHEIAITD